MGQSPEMHVDIGNFRYVTARNEATADTVAVTVSQGGLTFYVHVVHVGDGAGDEAWVTPSTRAPLTDTADACVPPVDHRPSILLRNWSTRAPYRSTTCSFRTGASELSGNDYPSLLALAAFLAEDPGAVWCWSVTPMPRAGAPAISR
jgi:hypothetical protein